MGAVDAGAEAGAAGAAIGAELTEKLKRADAGVTDPRAPAAGASQPAAVTAPGAAVVDESRRKRWTDGALFYGGVIRASLADDVAQHWTDERLRKLGEALARCDERYHWDVAPDHPLAQLGAAALPLAWPIAAPYVMPYVGNLLKSLLKLPASPETAAGSAPADTAASGDAAGAAVTVVTGEAAAPVIHRVKPLESES